MTENSPGDGLAAASGVYRGSARSFLLTVLGEFVLPSGEPVRTTPLLAAMAMVGVDERASRQAIARASSSGWVHGERHGREARWKITAEGEALLRRGERAVFALAEQQPWDGRWLIVLPTIPQRQRVARKKLYAALTRRGFGNPTPGVWVSPHLSARDEAARQIERHGLTESTLSFVGTTAEIGLDNTQIVERAWQLDELRKIYESLLVRFADQTPADDETAMRLKIELVNAWQHLPLLDPRPPEELVSEWVGRTATNTFIELRGDWHAAALRHWRRLM